MMDQLISGHGSTEQSSPASDISSNTDDGSYLEKYTHIRAIVVQQEKELQHLKIKYKALETMQELLTEKEIENSKLQREKMECESAISILQSRLASYGHSTSISFDDSDVFFPGPNKDLIKDLSKENQRLRQSLKFATVDPGYMESLIQENRKLKDVRDRSSLEFEEMRDSLHLLQKSVNASADEKDIKIVALQQQIEDLNKAKSTSELLCHSLSLESENLKHKLQQMASACQQLAKQLEQKSTVSQGETGRGKGSKQPQQESSVEKSEQFIELQSENSRLQVELLTHKQKLKDASDTNKRWQKFSDQREEYVKQLIKEIDELKKKYSKHHHAKEGHTSSDLMPNELVMLKDEKSKLEQDIRTLTTQLKQHKDIIKRMKEQISATSDAPTTEYMERINMLEHQVRICAEDFDNERKDKEKAQARIRELERELKSTQDQLHRHQVSEMNKMAYERATALQRYEEAQRQLHQYQPHNLVARGGYNQPGLDYVDGSVSGDKKQEKEDILQCPRCMKGFPSDRHNELLEHMDNCVD